MSDGHYRNLAGQHRAFMVYNGDGYYANKRSMVKVYLPPGNVELEQLVANKLYELQKVKYWPIERNTYINVRGRLFKHPLTKMKMMELATEVTIPHTEVLDWIKDNTNDLPLEAETLELGKEGWSVGPCIFKKITPNDHYGPVPGLYVKVRFNKMSIPFYLTDDKKTWVRDLTNANLQKDKSTKIVADSTMAFFDKNEKEILVRAGERHFNKSGIAEYEAPHVSFFNKVGTKFNLMFHQGSSNKVDQSKLADPNYKPVVTLKYGRQYGDGAYRDVTVAVVDDKFFEVKKYSTANPNWHNWQDDKVSFKESDLVELDNADEYVRERALRALRAKL